MKMLTILQQVVNIVYNCSDLIYEHMVYYNLFFVNYCLFLENKCILLERVEYIIRFILTKFSTLNSN